MNVAHLPDHVSALNCASGVVRVMQSGMRG